MDQRKGDPRIYIITVLFLSCILIGGVLLGLYLVRSDPNPLFLQAGMVFVGVPWLFWFLAYVYSCVLKPCVIFVSQSTIFNSKSVTSFDPEKGDPNKAPETVTTTSDPAPRNSPREGEKHVQFGNVVVLGDEEGGKEEDHNESSSNNLIQDHMRIEEEEDQENGRSNSKSDDDESSVDEDCDRTPLRVSNGNK
ncbi:hypothetical protein AtNW77_Chr5g0101651 [Arabidopsis thaliana]|jgi:hypothetical protein|uniref:Membrane lipoprotein n=4 Tax=Arabidopsis TaxID=3701 RepID=Q9LF65_ARATH|nr:Putative membrane lipoprotein [Arabidopsis thaliana]KAG7602603.1 hypothetical protein ISN45_At05g016480 [Arabidopsis thaliana x Arabidopsis arenosa]KAG7609540.1 hypothetical protein ISN44_As05g016370 [Arabidopsis suecica]AED92446.1 Putative membrane lipoprotein [Arabidopsis thaliana]OAO92949.1 hypothetical protein AXX17_AT5G17310 [Arabidopsis thaliana]CAA0403252.1 unnamed protein product [Arabidopsis thaliana]|eukprot:NP_197261.1 Putative membrane lipoprotein [Arabidopsis thaliana]